MKIIVIGAGMAGLTSAKVLRGRGPVSEASDGGRNRKGASMLSGQEAARGVLVV
jgi:hypothetical protein